MTLNHFCLLTNSQQIDLLYTEGVYIGKRKENGKTIVSYQLDSFYIEITYKKYRQRISHMACFTSTDLLHPYLQQIDVEELIRCAS